MENKKKINQMMAEGKISSNQAKLLIDALEESRQRSRKVIQNNIKQRERREKTIWGFLSLRIFLILSFVCLFLYAGFSQRLGKDTYKAIDYFNKAGVYLQRDEYQMTVEYCNQGIKQSPRFPAGYIILGATYKLIYEKTKDEAFKIKGREAFNKAEGLKDKYSKKRRENMIAVVFTLIFVILLLGVISIVVLLLYNSLVKNEEQVNQAWAQIGNLCQRKLDLIPALLEAVKSYSQHEKETLENVTRARANAKEAIENIDSANVSNKQKIKEFLNSQENISLGLGKLFALAEKYPDLKADAHFLTMQQQLQETEDTIAKERTKYNKVVRVYNSSIRYFPKNLIADLFKFEPKQYFEGGSLKQTVKNGEV